MIAIKRVTISHYGVLESYSNGKAIIYFDNEKQSTRDALNSIYLSYRKGNETNIITRTIDKEALLDNLQRSIDEYTEYIEDYNQQKRVEKHNARIRKIIEGVEKL